MSISMTLGGYVNWEVMHWEAGERTRPLTIGEFQNQLGETLAQWVDAHRGHDSEMVEDQIDGIVEDVSHVMPELLGDSLFKRWNHETPLA